MVVLKCHEYGWHLLESVAKSLDRDNFLTSGMATLKVNLKDRDRIERNMRRVCTVSSQLFNGHRASALRAQHTSSRRSCSCRKSLDLEIVEQEHTPSRDPTQQVAVKVL